MNEIDYRNWLCWNRLIYDEVPNKGTLYSSTLNVRINLRLDAGIVIFFIYIYILDKEGTDFNIWAMNGFVPPVDGTLLKMKWKMWRLIRKSFF